MTIRMLINATAPNELRIAIVEDGELTELDIEASETSTLKGNVYKGVVHNVEGSLEAAFVDIGVHKQGFLPFSEVSSRLYPNGKNGKKPKITEVLKRGQEIVVQVAKDAIGDKGATLTTYLSLPGRYTVLMPESDANGISRKIDDDKVRRRIRTIAQKIKKPEGCGFIVRTAGFGQTRIALQRDLDKVVEQFQKLERSTEMARAPSVIHSEPDLIGRTLRDFFSDEIDEVLIDSKEEYEAAKEYFDDVMPVYSERLKHYQNPIPIFAYHHVEEQIEATFERRVKLPSGGSIVVDETEALVAIDVNSGKMTSEGDHERTVFKTNCEAAEEVARQLKLRDLGGIVVVDFIDMEETKNKREVERVLAEMAKEDKARYKISRINSKGLCVLTRQRIRQGMRKAFQHRCPVCTGTGWLRTAESHSLSVLRRLEARLAQGGVGEARVLTHKDTAEYLLNHRRSELMALEKRYACRIVVTARAEMDRGHDEVSFLSNKEVLSEITDRLPPREERRGRRRAKKKKKRSTEAPEGAEVEIETEVEDGPSETRSKRRRKRRRGRSDGVEAGEAKVRPESKPEADTKPKSERRNGTESLAPKGTATFTGRPSPEAIERAKAERRARQARRDGDEARAEAILAELEQAENRLDPAEIEQNERQPEAAPVDALAPEIEVEVHPDASEMDVVRALAVADAIIRSGGAIDEAALLEVEGETDDLDAEAEVSDDLDAEAEASDAEDRSEAEVSETEDGSEVIGAEVSEVEDGSEAEAEDSEGSDVASDDEAQGEGRSRRRRRRRRGRRRRGERGEESPDVAPEGEPEVEVEAATVVPESVPTEIPDAAPTELPAPAEALASAPPSEPDAAPAKAKKSRNRSRSKARAEARAETSEPEKVEAEPEAVPPPPIRARVKASPEIQEARKALLLKIFGAR